MRFDDEKEGLRPTVVYTIFGVSAVILLILGSVLISNKPATGKPKNKKNNKEISSPSPVTEYNREGADFETLYRDHQLRAEDLDFWNMYSENGSYSDSSGPGVVVVREDEIPTPSPLLAADEISVDESEALPSETPTQTPVNLKLQDVDFTKLRIVNDQMGYYDGDVKLSKLGVEISQNSGKIDLSIMKSNGVDFVLLKAGSRGYNSGVINYDEYFMTLLNKCDTAGMDIGVFFVSAAVNATEAMDEASYVTAQLKGYDVKYPVAIAFERVFHDTSRTDNLTKEDRTKIIDAFMKQLSFDGYVGAIYCDADFLMNQTEYEKILDKYEVILNDTSPIPTFIYTYNMWRYCAEKVIPGMENPGSYIISFVDYSLR